MQRAIGHPPTAAGVGVHFVLMESTKLVRVVTRTALGHLAGRPLGMAEMEDVFYQHRARIETAACRKYSSPGRSITRATIDVADLSIDPSELSADTSTLLGRERCQRRDSRDQRFCGDRSVDRARRCGLRSRQLG